jgi:hypothetical protein
MRRRRIQACLETCVQEGLKAGVARREPVAAPHRIGAVQAITWNLLAG